MDHHRSAEERAFAPASDRLHWYLGAATILAVVAALLLGGAGLNHPWVASAVGLAALPALLCLGWTRPAATAAAPTRALTIWAWCALLLPVAQLIPLPPSWWGALPGRTIAIAAGEAAGQAAQWRPLSLTAGATLAAMTTLIAPIVTFLAVRRLDLHTRLILLRWIVAVALGSVVLAALQVAGGSDNGFTLFATAHQGTGVGLFVNRNHQAAFLLAAAVVASMPGVVVRPGATGPASGWLVPLVVLLLLCGVIATVSRTGLILIGPTLIMCVLLQRSGRFTAWRVAVGAAVLLVILVALTTMPAVGLVLHRFGAAGDDDRLLFWHDTVVLLGQFLPWGSGFGSFPGAYAAGQPLDEVAPYLVNHAHNDWLELLLEGGLPALVLVVAFAGLASWSVRWLVHRTPSRRTRGQVVGAAGVVAVLALHSLTDYPLRTGANMALFAVAAGLLTPPPGSSATSGRSAGRDPSHLAAGNRWRRIVAGNRWRRIVAVVALPLLAGLFVVQAAAASALLDLDIARAARVDPLYPGVQAGLAATLLLRGDHDRAADQARTAIALSPVDPVALRVLGLAEEALGRQSVADRLMFLAGALGWRDPLAQLWLIDRAAALGNAAVTMQRADALLRQDLMAGTLFPLLPQLARQPAMADALAERLATRPAWRLAFLNTLTAAPAADLPGMERTMRRLAMSAGPPDARDSRALIARVAAVRGLDAAGALWRALHHTAAVHDPYFSAAARGLDQTGLFEWRSLPLAGAQLTATSATDDGGGHALQVHVDGRVTGDVVEQTLLLPPGRHRLRYRLRGEGSGGATARWTLACVGARDAAMVVSTADIGVERWTTGAGVIAVMPSCRAQTLRLAIIAHDDGDHDVQITGVTVDAR